MKSRKWGDLSDHSEKRSLLCAMFWALVSCLAAFLLFEPNFQTNDDVFLSSLVAGKFLVSSPNEYYWPTNVLFCLALTWLAQLSTVIDWYSLIAYLMLYAASVAVYYSIHRIAARIPVDSSSRFGLRNSIGFLSLVHLLFFHTTLFVFPQFTNIAIFCVGSALLLVVSGCLHPPAGRKLAQLQLVVAFVLFLSGGLLRPDSVLALVVLSSAIALYGVFFARRVTWGILVRCVPAAFVLFAATLFDNAYYYSISDPAWGEFIRFRNVSTGMLDYDRLLPLSIEQISSVGWSTNDRDLMAAWWLVDDDVYSRARLSRLLQLSPTKTQGILNRVSEGAIVPKISWFPSDQLIVIGILLLAIVSLLSVKTSLIVFLLASGVWANFLLVDMMGRPAPWRVSFPVASIFFAASLVTLAQVGRARVFQQVCCMVITLGCITYLGWQIVPRYLEDAAYRRRMYTEIWQNMNALEGRGRHLYVVFGGDFPFELAVPPFSTNSLPNDVKIYWSALPAQAPFGKEMLRSFNVQEVLPALATREDLFLIVSAANERLIERAYTERYQKDVVFKPILDRTGLRVVSVKFKN